MKGIFKKMNKEDYQKYVEDKSPKSPIFMDCIKAFLVGGLICALGQIIFYFAKFSILLA